ncbi:MAG: hypothetical protein EBS85_07010 [Micrococcales bacterium]|nr:hypothetical protein [Actinomycetota bacterium]NCA08453.1 hypothetical protein [Micrococcales bacterium]
MDKSPDSKQAKLWALTNIFCSSELLWSNKLSDEKEPAYTKRVLVPQFSAFAESLNEKQLNINSDGMTDRPRPVTLNGAQDFYPDMSLDLYGDRGIAVEVKYLSKKSYSDALSKALGQAILYSAFGYVGAVVLLISKSGENEIAAKDLKILNSGLEAAYVSVHIVHQNLGAVTS